VGTLKLKTKDIPAVRASLLKQQEGIDPITGLPIEVPCLDHDHRSGKIRGVLDRKSNAWEGKVRNAFVRVGLAKTQADYADCLRRLADYVSKDYSQADTHPMHKTFFEKRLARNKKARLKRKRAKRAKRK
jgi:hypothetical protein